VSGAGSTTADKFLDSRILGFLYLSGDILFERDKSPRHFSLSILPFSSSMHLLAESGGSKTQWFLYDQRGLSMTFKTSGFNPNVQALDEIERQQRQDWGELLPAGKGLTVEFYGAGLGAPATEDMVRGILENLFPQASLEIKSDMLAAAYATCGDEAGIVCILGTGSNCCYWDGEKIAANLGSHGYLFSDEGSGADLGRTIVSAVLNGEVPHDVEHMFKDWVGKPMLDVRTEIYLAPKVNSALAEYSRFLAQHLDHPAIRYMVIGRFMAFFGRTVSRIKDHDKLPINFVGSIAEIYQGPLHEALAYLKLLPSKILGAPGDALFQYHLARLQAARG
jgi:glucosamine kinase